MGTDDSDPEIEFEDGKKTRGNSVPVFLPEDRDTQPHETIDNATFRAGLIAGRAEGLEEGRGYGREEIFEALRLALIEGKTDPGVAHLQTEKLRRWIELPANQALIDAIMQTRRAI